jgi:transposase-like protein
MSASIHCPVCGSTEIEILVSAGTLAEEGCICTACGYEFAPEESATTAPQRLTEKDSRGLSL